MLWFKGDNNDSISTEDEQNDVNLKQRESEQEMEADSLVWTAAQERQIIRHGYADEALGVLNDAEDGFDVCRPVFGAEDVRRALKQNNKNISTNSVSFLSLSVSL